MKKATKNKLKMYDAVIAVCTLHQSSWGFVPTFETQFDVFRNDHITLRQKLDVHGIANSGHSRAKFDALEHLLPKALAFSNALCLHAEISNDFQLMARNGSSRSNMIKGGLETMIARFNTLVQDAAVHIDALAPMGLTPADLQELVVALDAFRSAIIEPRQAILRKKQLTREIEMLQAKMDEHLRERLDRVMILIKKFDPEFYRLYKDARVTVDYKGRSAQITIEPPDENTP